MLFLLRLGALVLAPLLLYLYLPWGEARGLPLPIAPGSPELAELLAKAPQVPSVPPWAVPVEEGAEAVQDAASADELADNQSSLPPS